MVRPRFRPEPVIGFTRPEERATMREAVQSLKDRPGTAFPLVIGGVRVPPEEGNSLASRNPADPSTVLGVVAKARRDDADRALDAAWEAFSTWRKVEPGQRAACLYRAAAIMRRERWELDAWEVLEAGKPWIEADADVAEAIDFLEYYGRQMERLSGPIPLHPLPGEDDTAWYLPLGAGVVIAPWNFPLAILTGMCAGPVVAGNTVVLKPASATPILAYQFMRIMEEAGIPPGVINFLPGDGGEIGDHLVSHPRTRFVSFTGSREIGLRVNRLAAEAGPRQRWIKRVVAEMGGKDAILVDETADLERAAAAIVGSAFGYQGQKCSACSRAILVDSIYDEVLSGIVDRVKHLTVGPPEEGAYDLGPVIDARAYEKILDYIAWGKAHARLAAGGGREPGAGYFIAPTVFAEVEPGSTLEQEEIFGPVLSVVRAGDFESGLAIANDTDFGLTGAVFTRRVDRMEAARDRFHVGNLYINRKCTGAVVGAHPFGGFNLSGTDSKTGSADYLLLFLQMKAAAESF